jgi:hypothetical protein
MTLLDAFELWAALVIVIVAIFPPDSYIRWRR